MTHFHVDIWTPAGTTFAIKLVDFGADGVVGGIDDSEYEQSFNSTTTPALATGQWGPFDIPLSQFSGLIDRGNIVQSVWSGTTRTLFVDNIYFHN